MNHIQLIEYQKKYDSTRQETIKENIKRIMRINKVKHDKLCEILNISLHTSYSYTNYSNHNKPMLYNLLILAYYFEIDIMEFFNN